MADELSKSIKELLSFKVKPRQDGYSDQFSRLVMYKILLIGALVTGMNWYTDKINCIIPKYGEKDPVMDGDFVSSACWVNGLYIYEDIRNHPNKLGYYGIPNDINVDGKLPTGVECSTSKHADKCRPMEKTFFLQYQYMTFVLLGVGMLYYAPYFLFTLVNTDIVSLKASIKAGESVDTILSNYFNARVNPINKRRLRVIGTIIVKMLYIAGSVMALLILNGVLNGEYLSYGTNWLQWSKLNNTIAYDYMGKRSFPKPGNELLPSYGFCEVFEAAQDVKAVLTNKHKFVCEMSQHILYQYIFIVMWFAMVVSIVVSVIGFIALLMDHISVLISFGQTSRTNKINEHLSIRELQYLELMRRKNMTLYGNIIQKLEENLRSSPLTNHKSTIN